MPRVVALVLALAAAGRAGELELKGTSSSIEFHDGAKLYARCPDGAGAHGASVAWMSPTTINPDHDTLITMRLQGVPTTCADLFIQTPCADDPAFVPPLFFCNFVAVDGGAVTGPFLAERRHSTVGGVVLGTHSMLTCPLPLYEAPSFQVRHAATRARDLLCHDESRDDGRARGHRSSKTFSNN